LINTARMKSNFIIPAFNDSLTIAGGTLGNSLYVKARKELKKTVGALLGQGILKGEVSLYHLPPV
jgi:hypothetical protein